VLSLFFSYSHADELLRAELAKHLTPLKRSGLITTWYDREITAGGSLDATIMNHLEEADIVLLLVSADFIHSEYCYSREMNRALERHAHGSCVVIPVILRACDWQSTPLGKILATPRDGMPVVQWQDRDEAFLDVAQSIRKAVEQMQHRPFRAAYESKGVIVGDVTHEPLPSSTSLKFVDPNRSYSSIDTSHVIADGKDPNYPPLATRDGSTIFFSNRFAQAFPGVRGIEWFKQPVAAERLSLLLKQPLTFKGDDYTSWHPIWFWGRGNMHITSFTVESDDMVLLDSDELIIDEIAAVNPGADYRKFVYIRTRAARPSPVFDGDIDDQLAWRGYANEELGFYKGRYITRAEFDDGAAVIDGRPVDVRGDVELRIRYLTPYNFLIAAQFSPLNNAEIDHQITDLLNGILRGEQTLAGLTKLVSVLPKYSHLS
jgi:hypothetical protein